MFLTSSLLKLKKIRKTRFWVLSGSKLSRICLTSSMPENSEVSWSEIRRSLASSSEENETNHRPTWSLNISNRSNKAQKDQGSALAFLPLGLPNRNKLRRSFSKLRSLIVFDPSKPSGSKSKTSALDATPVRTKRTLSAFSQAQSKRAALPVYLFLTPSAKQLKQKKRENSKNKITEKSNWLFAGNAPHPFCNGSKVANWIFALFVLDFMGKWKPMPLSVKDPAHVAIVVQAIRVPHVWEASGCHICNIRQAGCSCLSDEAPATSYRPVANKALVRSKG